MLNISRFSSPSSSAKGSTSNPVLRRRWSSLAKPALGVALAMGVLTAGQAQAFVVNVGGQDWDVTTFAGSYNELTGKFAQPPAPGLMPWWGSRDTAHEFAMKVGLFFDPPPGQYALNGSSGPLFAYELTSFLYHSYGTTVDAQAMPMFKTPFIMIWGPAVRVGWPKDLAAVWAQATLFTPPEPPPASAAPGPLPAAPGPLPALGAAAAFGFSRKLRKRINASKGDSSRAATL